MHLSQAAVAVQTRSAACINVNTFITFMLNYIGENIYIEYGVAVKRSK